MERKLRKLTMMMVAVVALLLCAPNGWSLTTGVASSAPTDVSIHDYDGTAHTNSTEDWRVLVAVTAFTYDDAIVQAPKAVRQSDASPVVLPTFNHCIPHLLPRPPPTDASTTISRFLNAPGNDNIHVFTWTHGEKTSPVKKNPGEIEPDKWRAAGNIAPKKLPRVKKGDILTGEFLDDMDPKRFINIYPVDGHFPDTAFRFYLPSKGLTVGEFIPMVNMNNLLDGVSVRFYMQACHSGHANVEGHEDMVTILGREKGGAISSSISKEIQEQINTILASKSLIGLTLVARQGTGPDDPIAGRLEGNASYWERDGKWLLDVRIYNTLNMRDLEAGRQQLDLYNLWKEKMEK